MPLSKKDKASLLTFLEESNISHETGFSNFTQNINQPDALVLKIHHEKEIQKLICFINTLNQNKNFENKITVRVAAGGLLDIYSDSFSFTPCCSADIILHLMGKEFQKVEYIDHEKNIVRVGASVQMGDLEDTLYNKFSLCIGSSSLIPYVTFVGLTANSGHGTGRDQPAIAGFIQALTILKPNGEIVRIDASHTDFETIRASHLGMFGIILNVEIACIPAKKLECTVQTKNIEAFLGDIDDGLFYEYPYVSVMYIPTYAENEINKKDNHNLAIIKWKPVPLDTKDTPSYPLLKKFAHEIAIRLSEHYNMDALLEHHSHLIPYYTKYLVSKFGISKSDNVVIGPWPDIVHYQKAYPTHIDDADYLFQVSEDCKEIKSALTHAVTMLDRYAKKNQYPITHAIYIRFFHGTNGGLSTSEHDEKKYICGFDMVSNPNIQGYREFKKEMQDYFIDKLKSKPHWGKSVPYSIDYAKLYGKNFSMFKKTLINWYKECKIDVTKSPFLNTFHSVILQIPKKPVTFFERTKKDPLTLEKKKPENLQQIKQHVLTYLKATEEDPMDPHAKSFMNALKKIH